MRATQPAFFFASRSITGNYAWVEGLERPPFFLDLHRHPPCILNQPCGSDIFINCSQMNTLGMAALVNLEDSRDR